PPASAPHRGPGTDRPRRPAGPRAVAYRVAAAPEPAGRVHRRTAAPAGTETPRTGDVPGHRRPADPGLRPPAARRPRLRARLLPLRLAGPEVAALSRCSGRGSFPGAPAGASRPPPLGSDPGRRREAGGGCRNRRAFRLASHAHGPAGDRSLSRARGRRGVQTEGGRGGAAAGLPGGGSGRTRKNTDLKDEHEPKDRFSSLTVLVSP